MKTENSVGTQKYLRAEAYAKKQDRLYKIDKDGPVL